MDEQKLRDVFKSQISDVVKTFNKRRKEAKYVDYIGSWFRLSEIRSMAVNMMACGILSTDDWSFVENAAVMVDKWIEQKVMKVRKAG